MAPIMSEAIIDIATREERSPDAPAPWPPEPAAKTETQFVLRVLSGAQAGAQIELRPKRYKLGTDEDCDIVLIGDDISQHHISMFFADGCLSITHIHAPVLVEQSPINTLPLDLEPMQIFVLGNIAFAFGAENGEWPQPDDIGEHINTLPATSQMPALRPDNLHNLPALLLATLQQKLGLNKIDNVIKLIFGASLSVSVLIVLISLSLHSTEEPISIAHSAADRLHTHLKSDPAFAHLQLINTDPKKQLTGYVARTSDLNRLQHLARNAHTDLNVLSLEKLDKSLNVITAPYGAHLAYKLTPSIGRNINLLLYGTVKSESEREKIRGQLRRDLPAITNITFNIITQSDAMGEISTWLAQHPRFSGLSVQIYDKSIAIEGNLLDNFRAPWNKAMQTNPPYLPQGMKPTLDVYFGPHFPAHIVSLVTGENAQIRLTYKNNNTEIAARVGDQLKGGFTLKKISRRNITLGWRGRDFIYHIPN